MLVPETRYCSESADRHAPPVETLTKLLDPKKVHCADYSLPRHCCLFLMKHGGRGMVTRGRQTFLTFNLQVDASRFVGVMQRVNVNHVKVYIHGRFEEARNVLCKT
jgi:hypothetical protein